MSVSYLDYMASTPIDPAVLAAMQESLTSNELFGNPSSQNHRFGWLAADRIEQARRQVAELISADPREIIWTSGATEAVNLALKGAAHFYQRKGKHIIALRTEHAAVLQTCAYLENQGFAVTYLNPTSKGLLNPDDFANAVRPDTILAAIMWVNNETGVSQDLASLAAIAKKNGIILFVDAAQAIGKIPVDVKTLPIDLMAMSAHKVYGPKGIGALFVRRTPRIRLQPLIHGGEQEYGLRSGTLPTHQIIGMGAAFAVAKHHLLADIEHVQSLGQRLWQGLQTIPEVTINGDFNQRVPHCFNISIQGIEAETLLVSLADFALSTGSACHSAHNTPSHVLTAMGISAKQARSALRISYGRFTTAVEIDRFIEQLHKQVANLRMLSPVGNQQRI